MQNVIKYVEDLVQASAPSADVTEFSNQAQLFIDEISAKLTSDFIDIQISNYNSANTNKIATTNTNIKTDVENLIKTQLLLPNVIPIFKKYNQDAFSKRKQATVATANIVNEYNSIGYNLVNTLKSYVSNQLGIVFFNALPTLFNTTVYPDGQGKLKKLYNNKRNPKSPKKTP